MCGSNNEKFKSHHTRARSTTKPSNVDLGYHIDQFKKVTRSGYFKVIRKCREIFF